MRTLHYYVTTDRQLMPCTLVDETATSRTVELTSDHQARTVRVHPDGVAWGKLYPRYFKTTEAPSGLFVHKGRTMLVKSLPMDGATRAAIPDLNTHYRFQPFLADVIDSIHAGENVILTGGTGVGKTSHIAQLAARVHQPLLRINFNGETRMSDLIGKMSVVGGETRWVDGVLPTAMRKGWWLLLDELDFADPAVLSLLHPVLEEEPMLVLKENAGEIIKPHPNFRLFATANSIGAMSDRAGSYSGTNTMNEAFLDRWQVIMVENLPQKEEVRVIRGEVPGLKSLWARRMVEFANRMRNQELMNDLQFAGDNFSTRKVLAWARKTALHRDPVKGAKLSWLDKSPAADQEVLTRLLHTVFGARALKAEKVAKPTASPALGKKRRGRPPKALKTVSKRRGRPPKAATVAAAAVTP